MKPIILRVPKAQGTIIIECRVIKKFKSKTQGKMCEITVQNRSKKMKILTSKVDFVEVD